jgi:hypothetical protein
MTSPADYLRSFGMTGYIISDELKKIEERFDLELNHLPRSVSQTPVEYYPQFQQAIRSEAADMSRYYEVFYCLENSIRQLITETMEDTEGSVWWTSGRIPRNIVDEVSTRLQREIDSGVTVRSERDIDYTTFGELSIIITSNWDLFSPSLSSKRAVERVMSNLNLLRGPIAHCSPVSEDEILRLQLAVKDWFRMMS